MIVFVTKSLCYHQVYVADDLYEIYGDSFAFIQMREPLDWRVKNHQEGFDRKYLITYPSETKKAKKMIKEADVIVFGEAPLKLIKHRKKNCLLFKMSENIFKDTQFKTSTCGKIKRWLSYKYLKFLTNNSHSFLLACGGFAYNDYEKMNIFNNRALKWGYFPRMPNCSIQSVKNKFDNKGIIEMVWVSRLVKYKNPLVLISLANHLLEKGIDTFHINVVGDSSESDYDFFSHMQKLIKDYNLSKYISMIGKVNAEDVFDYYKMAHIALFTSDKSEGWSVGISEAMSCGCVVIASNVIGAVPFLIDKSNGLVYEYGSEKQLFKCVIDIMDKPEEMRKIGVAAFNNIHGIWNHKNAANSFSNLVNKYLEEKIIEPAKNGPCSIASHIDFSWGNENK